MKLQETVHNLIILDESGSMHSIKEQIISGFNEVVQTVKGVAKEYPEQKHYITFTSFNSLKITTHLDAKPVTELKELNGDEYRPNATTPLFDAMGNVISNLREKLKNDPKANVLVTILTDGRENASEEYDSLAIKSLVEEMEEKNWTFTYIGTNHDVEGFANSISIKNTMSFGKSQEGLRRMFEREKMSRILFSKRIRQQKIKKDNFYSNAE